MNCRTMPLSRRHRRRSLLLTILALTMTTKIRRLLKAGKNGAIWDQIQIGFTRQGNSHSGARYYVMEAAGPFRLFLSQICSSPESGLYTLRAQVMSIGGLNAATMIVKDYGGPNLDVPIPTTNTWTQITIPNISCDSGSARVGFWADSNGGNWIAVDDVEFFKQ
jgi:hypothetical protein